MKNLFFIAVLLCFVSGCITANTSTMITGRGRPPISPDLVKIYDSAPTNSETIGVVSVTNPSGPSHYLNHPENDLLKKSAAAIGANGIVLGASSVHVFVGYQQSAIAIFVP